MLQGSPDTLGAQHHVYAAHRVYATSNDVDRTMYLIHILLAASIWMFSREQVVSSSSFGSAWPDRRNRASKSLDMLYAALFSTMGLLWLAHCLPQQLVSTAQ